MLLAVRPDHPASSTDLLAVVEEAAEAGWVSPFLGLGPRVERVLRSVPIGRLHPRLGRALSSLVEASRRPAPVGREADPLTSREVTLLQLLPTRLSYAEIGERLYLSVHTVRSNLQPLYRKLEANSRREAVEEGARRGLL